MAKKNKSGWYSFVRWFPGEWYVETMAMEPVTLTVYMRLAACARNNDGRPGALVTTLVYALACVAASRWIAGLRRGPAEIPHAAVLPLLGTTAVIIAMMVAGPAIATLLPRNPDIAVDTARLLPGYFAMLVPVCAGFFAAQMLTRPRRTAEAAA